MKKEPFLSNLAAQEKQLENPYVFGQAGRQEWNDRYLNMKEAIRHWQWAFAASSLITVGLGVTIAWISSQSQIKPFIVETNQGAPIAMRPLEEISEKDHRLINYAINQFIINAKTIVSDVDAQSALLKKLYAYTADDAVPFLRQYHHGNDPFVMAQQTTTQVSIVHAMPINKNTWQVTWDETIRARSDNQVTETHRWIAQLRYKISEVNPLFVMDNPFGIVITDVHWSAQHNNTV